MASSLAPVSLLNEGNRKLVAWDTFNRANGPLTNSADGQAYQLAGTGVPSNFRVLNNMMALGALPTGSTQINSYAMLGTQNGLPIDTIIGEFVLEPAGTGDTGNPTPSIAVVITGDTTLALANLCHLLMSPTGWNFQTRVGGSGNPLNTWQSGTFNPPLVADGVTRHRVEMSADVVRNQVTLRLPDGSTAVVTQASITSQIIGQYGFWQVIDPNSTAPEGRFTSIALFTKDGTLPFGVFPKPQDLPRAISAISAFLQAALVPRSVNTFTPNATGWWRVWGLAGTNDFGGLFNISTPASAGANITDIALNLNMCAFTGSLGSIQQTRWGNFQSGCVSQARIGSDGSNHLYFDLFVSTANIPIAVEGIGVQVNGVQNNFTGFTPILASSDTTQPTNTKTLILGPGFRTTDGVYSNGTSLAPAALTFTPNATGWWRVYDLAGINIFSGNLQISSPTSQNANITDVSVDVDVVAFTSTSMGINESRYSGFQSGAVSQIRVGNDGSNHLYVDINVSAANIPITIAASGVQIPSGFATYVPSATSTPPTNSKTLTLGYGLRTTGPLFVGTEGPITATGNVNTNVKLTEIDATSGSITLTLPNSTTVPGHEHMFTRVDSTANTVSILAQFSDGTTTKTMTNAASLRVIGSGAANRWAL